MIRTRNYVDDVTIKLDPVTGAEFVASISNLEIVGLQPNTPWTNLITALGANATVTIPGPAVGFWRVFGQILVSSNNPALTVTVDGLLQPGVWQIFRAQGTSTSSTPLVAPLMIANGESVDITNTTANVGTILSNYIDIAATNYTAVRALVTGVAPTTLIPAPAIGKLRKWVTVARGSGSNLLISANPWANNNDTVLHRCNQFINGVFVSCGAGTNAVTPALLGNMTGPESDIVITSATGPLSVQSVIAIVTNPIVVAGVYKEI